MRFITFVFIIIVILAFGVACDSQNDGGREQMLEKMVNKFAETEIKYDESLLNNNQKKVVENLYHASKIMDDLFFINCCCFKFS